MNAIPARAASLALLLLCGGASRAEPPSRAAEAGWAALAEYRYGAALGHFEEAGAKGGGRYADLGRAAALFGGGAVFEGDHAEVVQVLEQLAAASPTDEVTWTARYLLARDAQLRPEPDWERAARLYREVLEQAPPGHALAQQAAVKLALLTLYWPRGTPDERLAAAERLGSHVQDADARRDLHLALGRAAVFFGHPPAVALRHFEFVLAAGLANPVNRASTLITVGELATRAGQPERARVVYQAFLDEFPRDSRTTAIRTRLEQIR